MDHNNIDTMLQLYFLGQAPADQLGKIVDGLISHFTHEEEVISRLGFQFPEEHRCEHGRLAKTLRQDVDDWKGGNIDGSDLAERIRALLLLHVSNFDAKLRDYQTLPRHN